MGRRSMGNVLECCSYWMSTSREWKWKTANYAHESGSSVAQLQPNRTHIIIFVAKIVAFLVNFYRVVHKFFGVWQFGISTFPVTRAKLVILNETVRQLKMFVGPNAKDLGLSSFVERATFIYAYNGLLHTTSEDATAQKARLHSINKLQCVTEVSCNGNWNRFIYKFVLCEDWAPRG